MIPHMSLKNRVIAWLLWHLNGYHKDVENAEFEILKHPELSRSASILRDYWYARKNPALKEVD